MAAFPSLNSFPTPSPPPTVPCIYSLHPNSCLQVCSWENPEAAIDLSASLLVPWLSPDLRFLCRPAPSDIYDPETGGCAVWQLVLTLMVAAGGKVIHKVAEEVMELKKNQRLGFRDECQENQEGSRSAAPPPGTWAVLPLGWKAELRVTPPPIPPHLDLVLLSRILYRLEDAPGAMPPHLQPCRVAPVPSLDEGCCPEGCDRDGEASL